MCDRIYAPMKNLEKILLEKRRSIKAIYVSSYIPRKCGIATYTKDLTNDINKLNPYALAEILVINRPEENLTYPWEVKFRVVQNNLETYLQAANYVNQSEADVILLEHEFGLYAGNCGDYIIPFIESVKKPKVITFHTVIDDPSTDYGMAFKRLSNAADAIVVMLNDSAKKISEKYNINKEKIAVIPHGTPDLALGTTEYYKKNKRLKDKIVLGNINLLSDNKGLEYTLEAVSLIAKKYPNVIYLIIGQTHPVVLKNEGETYRNLLKKKVKKLGIGKNVRFINEYISLKELIEWLQAMDIYITPYLNPDQSASGALAYAIGAGKSCISSPYLYAKEVLSGGRGILVPFRDSKAIADSILDLLDNPEKRNNMEKKAYEFGRLMTWSNVALQHLDLFKVIMEENNNYQ